jgi:hypothetical protein
VDRNVSEGWTMRKRRENEQSTLIGLIPVDLDVVDFLGGMFKEDDVEE